MNMVGICSYEEQSYAEVEEFLNSVGEVIQLTKKEEITIITSFDWKAEGSTAGKYRPTKRNSLQNIQDDNKVSTK